MSRCWCKRQTMTTGWRSCETTVILSRRSTLSRSPSLSSSSDDLPSDVASHLTYHTLVLVVRSTADDRYLCYAVCVLVSQPVYLHTQFHSNPQIRKTFGGHTAGQTYVRTLRPTFLGRLGGVDLKSNFYRKQQNEISLWHKIGKKVNKTDRQS